MGVTIQIKDGEKSVTMPYGSLGFLRAIFVQSYILYIEKNLRSKYRIEEKFFDFDENEGETLNWENEDEVRCFQLKKVRSLLLGALRVTDDGEYRVDFEKFKKKIEKYHLRDADPLLVLHYGAGLYKLINHSDCDGYHSRGDVEDILEFLYFFEFMKEENLLESSRFHKDGFPKIYFNYITQLRKVFEEASARKTIVIYL